MSALATKRILEEETFKNIKLVVLSLPIFRPRDNFDFFVSVFQRPEEPYVGNTPVLIMDQDMHAIALAAASAGFVVGDKVLNNSHSCRADGCGVLLREPDFIHCRNGLERMQTEL